MHGVKALAQLFWIASVCGAAFGSSCITSHPQTVIGYAGERLTYSCESYCGEKFWRLNGFFADGETEFPYRAVIDDGRISTLSVEASAATNNSVVTCWLYNPPNNEESNAEIIVQGTVAEPTIILFSYDDNHVNLSWNQPYTLPETELEFAINVSMGSNYRLFTTAETRISFSYSFLNIDHCISDHTVNITVYGVNGAGEGEPSFVQAVIPQSQSKNCSEAIYQLGPPIDINTVVEEKSLTLSWQPPLLMLAPGVMLCYKISVNVTESLDPQNILTQFVSNCTYNTTYVLSLSSIGINRCNRHYLIEIHVVGVSSAQVEGDFATIVEVISSIESCSPTVSEEPNTVFETNTDAPSNFWITIAAAVISPSLIIGLSIALITVLLKIKKHRSKTLTFQHDVELKESAAYGISSMIANEAYGCHSDEDLHIYEEIVAKEIATIAGI